MPLQPGDRLGPYEIISLLGAGGMGEVYLSNDPRLQRKVAVKVLSAETANDPAIRQRFEVEARAASHISHPNIVAVYDFGNQDGLLYIVWELVDGKPLLSEPMPLRKALEIQIFLLRENGMRMQLGRASCHRFNHLPIQSKPKQKNIEPQTLKFEPPFVTIWHQWLTK